MWAAEPDCEFGSILGTGMISGRLIDSAGGAGVSISVSSGIASQDVVKPCLF